MKEYETAIIFPGQGAQYPGMGKDFYTHRQAARDIFDRADDLLHQKFSEVIFEADAKTLSQTDQSQLAIYITSCALFHALIDEFPEMAPKWTGGLSLGEYTALTASSRLSFEEGLNLVKARGIYMQEAATKHPGTMAAVLGLDEDQISEILTPFQEQGAKVWIANLNCPKQVVIAGEKGAITVVEPILRDRGAKRLIFLDVSGAFHTPLMQLAQEKLALMIENTMLSESDIKFVSNVSGGFLSDSNLIKQKLIEQVASPVRWESDVRAIEEDGAELFIEVGCGKTLAGMNRKIQVKPSTISIDQLKDLNSLEQTLSQLTTVR